MSGPKRARHGQTPPLHEGPALRPGTEPGPRPPPSDLVPVGIPQTPQYAPRPYGRGNQWVALRAAVNPAECERFLLEGASAPNSRGPLEARKQLWRRLGLRAGFADPFNLTPSIIYTIMGALKAADYRSAELYLDSARAEHISLGRPWTDQLTQARRAALRSCRRYLGSPKQARSLPLKLLGRFRSQPPSLPRPSYAPGLVVATEGDRGISRSPRPHPGQSRCATGHLVTPVHQS